MPDTADSCIRPRPDRIESLAVPAAAFAADQMACHLRHWYAPGQPQDLGIEIEVALRPAGGAVDLKQLPLPNQVIGGSAGHYKNHDGAPSRQQDVRDRIRRRIAQHRDRAPGALLDSGHRCSHRLRSGQSPKKKYRVHPQREMTQ